MTIAFQRWNGTEWVTETESASGGVTNHASLTNLAFENAGHTGPLDMKNTAITDVDYVGMNVNGNPAYAEGRMFYDEEHKCWSGYTDNADFTHNYGREITMRVRNTSGSAMSEGDLVYFDGTNTGHTPDIALAKADAFETQTVVGMLTVDIANNGFGEMTKIGAVHGVNTDGVATNTILYLSPDTAGAWTATKPDASAGEFVVPIGQVVYSHVNNGIVDVNIIHFPVASDIYGGGALEYMMLIWGEENSSLGSATYEWAFGNGANTPSNNGIAIYVPTGWTCTLVAMSGTINNAAGSAVIEADLDGVLQGALANVTISGRSTTNDSFTPVAIPNNTRLTFRTTTATTTTTPCTVCAWLRMVKT